jgi:hypothetical protein
MPRVTHVKAARKDNQVCKKGESYFWWKFRYGGKRYSLKYPRPSQLTQSAYYGTVRSLSETLEDQNIQANDELVSARDDIVSELENLRDETQESLDNMPDSLQYSPTGELLQERVDAVENAIGEVECVEEFDEDEPDESDFGEEDEECSDCNGDGVIDEEDGDEECENCNGTGQIEGDTGEEEFNCAQNEWQDNLNSHVEEAVNEMNEAISNCEV